MQEYFFDLEARREELKKRYGAEADVDAEIVANSMFDVLSNEKAINSLAEENPSLLRNILKRIKAFIDDIKAIIAQLGEQWAEVKALSKDLQALESIRWLMESALSQIDTTSQTEKNTVTGDGVVKYSRIPTQKQIDDIRTIGRKSVNSFTDVDIKKTEYWARIMYDQLGVKSPFFRAWFGDWRAYDKTPVTVATNKGSNRGFVKNLDTDYNINISATVFNETKKHRSRAVKNAVPYLDYIEDIVKNAILLDTFVIDNPKSENSLFMHSFYAVANIGNGNELLKLFVEEMNDPNSTDTAKRAYQLQYIKIASTASVRVQNNPSSLTNTVNAIYNVANLFSVVKSEDASFNPVDIHPSMLNSDGTPVVLYHQTENTFTVFDTKHPGAGTGDYETPFGIFMKPSESDIGLKGKKQMQLYAHISNPLVVNTREELVRELKQDKNILKVLTEIEDTDRKYENDVDNATKAFEEYVAEYRKNHPDEPRKEIYNDSRFDELYYAEDNIIEEWTAKIDELTLESKDNIVSYLKNNGYDGVILEKDVGSFGRSTKTIIALDNTQVKSVSDNIGTFDASNSDIRYSYAGRKAKTANIARLEEAMRLEDIGKATAEEIRQQTGWFRGYDGEWRFEIDDSKMQFSRSGDIRLMQDPNYQRLEELSNNYRNLNKDEKAELLALEEQFEDDILNDDKLLIDYVSHPELFEAYPQLKNVNLTFVALNYSEKGYFDPRTNTIVLNSVTQSEWKKTIIHELQHAIQRIEGFATGANKEVWTERMKQLGIDNPKADRVSYLYNRTAGEIEARDSANRIDYDAEQRNNTRPDIDSEDVAFINDFHKNGNNDDIKYSLKSVDKKQQKEYNDIRKNRKRAPYNENETLFMQWQHGNSASVGDTRAFIRLDKKLHFYQKTENGCIEITSKEFDFIRYSQDGDEYDKAEISVDTNIEKNGIAKRGNIESDAVYGYSSNGRRNVNNSERKEFHNDQQGNLERSRDDSEEASEIKLSLQSTDAAAQAREKLIKQNKNLRVANMILKQELIQTHGKMLTYDGAKALAKDMISNFSFFKNFNFLLDIYCKQW